MTLEQFATDIHSGKNEGLVIGKGKRNYTLWSYWVNGYKIYYTFKKMLSSDIDKVTGQYPDVFVFEDLESNWRAQAELTGLVNKIRRDLQDKTCETEATIPFGKYTGKKMSEMTDVSYLCWLCNARSDYSLIKPWLREAAKKRAIGLNAVDVFGCLVDPNSDREWDKNTYNIYNSVKSHENIVYTASRNDGTCDSYFFIELPQYHTSSYYGVASYLNVDGKAKKAKGLKINIYDYEVEDNFRIKVKGFYVMR